MRKISVAIISLVLLVSTIVGITLYVFNRNISPQMNHVFEINDSIVIESDADFETYGFIGTGTENDPYLIENIIINNSDMDSIGIYITGTTKHFIIRNCTIDVNMYGVDIFNISSGTAKIVNNTIFSCYFGISILFASGTSIINNTITRYRYGSWPFMFWEITIASIQCRFSDNLEILYNNFTRACDAGIYLEFCNYVNIIKTTCSYSPYGILCEFSSYINVYNCIFAYHGQSGIELNGGSSGSDYVTIINNKFEECGIIVGMRSYPLTIENNTVNGKLLGYFEYASGLNLNKLDYGQIILYKCNSITVSNQIIEKSSIGLILLDCDNIIITNNSLFNNQYGISVSECSNSVFSNNNCSFNYKYGINIVSSWYSEFSNNLCNDNNKAGIFFDGNAGRYIGSKPHDNLIFNNKIVRNGYGIDMWYTDNTEISYNLIQDNIEFGVGIGMNSEGNIVHHNKFINNCINTGNPQGSQNYGESPNNLWYDISTEEGNYWSDWNGTGPYRIFTYEGEVYDLYPLYELELPNGQVDQEKPISSTFSLVFIKKIKYNNKT